MSSRSRECSRSARASRREWVGGTVSLPFYVTEGEPYRPDMALWMELPSELVVGMEVTEREQTVSLGQTLLAAMRQPMAGPPRRPDRIRVADEAQAVEVRAVVPDIAVHVGPTPELDHVMRAMAEHGRAGDSEGPPPSYLEDGRVDASTVGRLFRAAEGLYRVAPWETMDDDQVVRLDIPALGVRGACGSAIGALGDTAGIVVFPSFEGFERFIAATSPGEAPLDLGTTMLSLTFVRGRELPEPLHAEVAHHGWPVADADAYPWVEHRDRDAMPRPLSEHDVRVATACAQSMCDFFATHRGVFSIWTCGVLRRRDCTTPTAMSCY